MNRRATQLLPTALGVGFSVAALGLLGCGSTPPPPRALVGAHRSTPAEEARRAFWSWFTTEEARLAASPPGSACAEVESHLEPLALDLTCEILPVAQGGRQLVLGAGGKRSAFPTVRALVAAAPPLPGWTLLTLRPRRTPLRAVRQGDVVVSPAEVEYALFPEGRKIGIALYFDRAMLDDPLTMRRIGFLLLDDALGEEDVTEHVGRIDWRPKGTSGVPRRTLLDLAADFDAARARHR